MAGKPQYDWPSDSEIVALAPQCSTQAELATRVGVGAQTLRNHMDARGIKAKVVKALRGSTRNPVERAKAIPEQPAGPSPEEEELARKLLAVEKSRAKAQAEARAAKGENRELEDERDKALATLSVLTDVESVKAPDWLAPSKKRTGHHGTLVSLFSDFHIGEAVDNREMNGYNAYSAEIAEQRIRRFFERTILVAKDYLAGVTYDGIVMPNLGDTISGDIHEEFVQTNELSNYKAIPLAVSWLKEGIGMLADEFGKVHVPCVPGNHPRDSRKPRYKKRSEHNADTLISELVAGDFKNDDRVTFDIPASLSADFSVYDTKFRIEHGDEAKGGTGIAGAFTPLALHTHKRRKQAQAEGTPFDVLVMGHWHQLMFAIGKGFIVNGAGKGYDEYARGKSFDPEPPQQALMVLTPEHGITAQLPLFVGKRSSEGW